LGFQLIAVSALTGDGADALNAFLGPGQTIVLLGSSGWEVDAGESFLAA